ncbi:hypothetical protein [Neorhizobium sp. NCHU2750]|uniref:hypothetical protein n=1 Tax=Neorhizobium sp. NCHU2750 TaxID=1825976 RepID=UPI000E73680E|nr:hypothetical protein NCHU2750_28460 [Neorhizobium sp. NCHU2750]
MSKTSTIHPMLQTQVANASIRAVQIAAVAKHLADLMREVHGGRWRTVISHDTGFVLINQDLSDPVDKSNSGEN